MSEQLQIESREKRLEALVRDFLALLSGDLSGSAQWAGVIREAREELGEE